MAISPEKSEQITKRRRREILDSAIVLFEENGFEKTRIQDIANRAQVSKGLVYRYFPSKDAIFQELYGDILECITGELYTTASVRELLTTIGCKMFSVSSSAQAVSSLRSFTLAFIRGDLPEGANANFIKDEYARKYLAPAFARGQQAGEVVPGDPEMLARHFWGTLLGLLLLHDKTSGAAAEYPQREEAVANLVSLFLVS